jgi:hypothetical protein
VLFFALAISILPTASAIEAAAGGVIPATDNVYLTIANDAGVKYNIYDNDTYYIKFDTGGLNSLHISTDPSSVPEGQVTTSNNRSGTFYITDTGGKGYDDDAILMLAVNGTIPEDFCILIKSSGYNWTPTSDGNAPTSDEINVSSPN